MESPLEVLSRAATMVQDNAGESRLTNKELPTAKWRRDRRIRLSAEYHQPTSPNSASNGADAAAGVGPLGESNIGAASAESPLDMSAKPPPPPYREPLPGSQFAHHLARPSVITQAPKRETTPTEPSLVVPLKLVKQENQSLVRAVAAISPIAMSAAAQAATASTLNESISMIDPVIDEHFRRSLGADYAALFGNNKKPGAAIKPTPIAALRKQQQPSPSISATTTAATATSNSNNNGHSPAIAARATPTVTTIAQSPQQHSPSSGAPSAVTLPLSAIVAPTIRTTPPSTTARRAERERQQQQYQLEQQQQQQSDADVGMSVDDHFAKALGGDTWKQLQRAESRSEESAAASAAASSRATGVKHEIVE